MENRFGFKELVISALLVVLILVVGVSMWQWDRQWSLLQRIHASLEEQNQTLIRLNDTLRRGVTVAGGAAVPAADTAEAFERLLEPRDNDDFAFGDWFVDSFSQTVGKLTPVVPADAYQGAVAAYVLESLITRDPETLEWRPWIASDWEVSEDGLTISFDIRDGVTFSDGEPLTADDVVFTYQLIMNPAINAPALRSYYENVASVEADGPLRVVFRMKRPYFLSLEFTGGMQILAEHFYSKFTPEEFNQMPGLLFGSGPYKLAVPPAQWQPGSGSVELVRNDRYWGPRPTFDRLVWREIADPTAELTTFRNGGIDVYSVPPHKYPTLKDDPDLLADADLYAYRSLAAGYRYIGWNQERNGEPTIFADADVRKALTLLTPRQQMADQLMSGLAVIADGPFNPLGDQDDPAIEPWPYDPQQARDLLASAGWADRDGDGILENAAGEPFRFELMYPAGREQYEQMVFFLKDAYARAGIALEPAATEWNTMIERIQARDLDAITLGWTGSIEGDPKQIFHSESIAEGGSNYVNYSNPELDALIDQARRTVDEDKRMEMWHQVHQIIHEDQPYTFLFYTKSVIFIDQRIRNVEITKLGLNPKTEMYVPQTLQQWGE